jgi:hypothetical protein
VKANKTPRIETPWPRMNLVYWTLEGLAALGAIIYFFFGVVW